MKSLIDLTEPIQHLNIVRHLLTDDGTFPNNGLLPLLYYPKAIRYEKQTDSAIVKEVLETNNWRDLWEDSIYDYPHYHSTAHEVLVVSNGSARVQFGGDAGITIFVERGDMVVIPAGVAHKKLDATNDFVCIGGYPDGQQYDMNYGKPGERPKVDENIKHLALPENDPLYGNDGPLIKNWYSEKGQATSIL